MCIRDSPNTEPPGEHAVSLDECWEKCASVYVDLVSVDYWPNGIEAYPGVGPCWCQTSCTHITFDHVTESQYPELAIVSGTIPADSGLVCGATTESDYDYWEELCPECGDEHNCAAAAECHEWCCSTWGECCSEDVVGSCDCACYWNGYACDGNGNGDSRCSSGCGYDGAYCYDGGNACDDFGCDFSGDEAGPCCSSSSGFSSDGNCHDADEDEDEETCTTTCLLYTSPSPRDATLSRMPSSA